MTVAVTAVAHLTTQAMCSLVSQGLCRTLLTFHEFLPHMTFKKATAFGGHMPFECVTFDPTQDFRPALKNMQNMHFAGQRGPGDQGNPG